MIPPRHFNLSHMCPAYVPPRCSQRGAAEVAGAVQTSGDLPYTGSNSSIPLAQMGVALLAVGALVTFAVRRRNHTSEA